jgi:DNA-binding GntR family transcriptional regulator
LRPQSSPVCGLSGNKHLFDYAQRILTPFFAFVRSRMISGRRSKSVWNKDLDLHQRIVDLLREGDGDMVEQYVKKAMVRFAKTAYDNWVAHGKQS